MIEALRALAGRAPSPEKEFARFRAKVEKRIAATPRVHRFASPPVLGDQTIVPARVTAGRLEDADSPWVVLADGRLSPSALERFGRAAALAPDAKVITCDEDVLDAAGRRSQPHVFPGPSPDQLLATDGPLGALCVRRDAALGALAAIPEGPASRYELLLTLAGHDGAGHAHVPAILLHRAAPATPLDASAAAAAARVSGARVRHVAAGRRRVERPVRGEPLVEVVVPFHDRSDLLARCADSVLRRSSWERVRLRLVDNGSTELGMGTLLARLEGDPRVTVMHDHRPFNFAALNNAAVAASDADVVVFLNNDTEVITPAWIEELLAEAQRAEVGAVAPLLRYPDGTVQHAGAALGLHGYAGHPFAGLAPDAPTPFGRADDGTRNWLAVTAACLMVERAKFDAVGGFDERFVVAGNDVDLCLRLTARGHRSLCVPHVEMLHDESLSRGAYIAPGDFARSEASYGAFRTVGDPFYNPNLTLTDTTCRLRQPGEAV